MNSLHLVYLSSSLYYDNEISNANGNGSNGGNAFANNLVALISSHPRVVLRVRTTRCPLNAIAPRRFMRCAMTLRSPTRRHTRFNWALFYTVVLWNSGLSSTVNHHRERSNYRSGKAQFDAVATWEWSPATYQRKAKNLKTKKRTSCGMHQCGIRTLSFQRTLCGQQAQLAQKVHLCNATTVSEYVAR